MIDKFDLFVSKIANLETIKAIKKGLTYAMPLTLIGSAIIAILNFPVKGFQNLLNQIFGSSWELISNSLHKGTIQIISIFVLLTVSYALATESKFIKRKEIDAAFAVLAALSSYVILTSEADVIISVSDASILGMFKSFVISILATKLFLLFYRIQERILQGKTMDYNGNLFLLTTFRTILPTLFTILAFSILKLLIATYELDKIPVELIDQLYLVLIKGDGYLSELLIIVLTHICWFFGIHGGNVVMGALYNASLNFTDISNQMFTLEFFNIFAYLGGAGATLGLLIALIINGKKQSESKIAKYSLIPGIFNINEIIIYGLPLILNPYYFIPFLLTPIVLGGVTFLGMKLGWVPPIIEQVSWSTPIFISGYICTGSIAGAVMQGINLIISVLIYTPFVLLNESHQKNNQKEIYKKLEYEVFNGVKEPKLSLLERNDEIGNLARGLGNELKLEVEQKSSSLYMEYQPKSDADGKVMGAEALIRWVHPEYGYVSPLVILSLAEESGISKALGTWTFHYAFRDLKRFNMEGFEKLVLSANLSPLQLWKDKDLVDNIRSCINENNIKPGCMEFELTENAAIDSSQTTLNKLEKIRDMGIGISIDDFGMGHSSLHYICDFCATVVKIDASLISKIATDKKRQQIVKSILSLCKELRIGTVAEGVETLEQIEVLEKFGCEYYQGFYFSKSLSADDFIEYVRNNGTIYDRE